MKKNLLRHMEILKTLPEIKESIEELKFGCYINTDNKNYIVTYYDSSRPIGTMRIVDTAYWREVNYDVIMGEIKIIWQIEERHLRMFYTHNNWLAWFTTNCLSLWTDNSDEKDLDLDDSKPYMEQSEKFFKKLNDWICKEFNINL